MVASGYSRNLRVRSVMPLFLMMLPDSSMDSLLVPELPARALRAAAARRVAAADRELRPERKNSRKATGGRVVEQLPDGTNQLHLLLTT